MRGVVEDADAAEDAAEDAEGGLAEEEEGVEEEGVEEEEEEGAVVYTSTSRGKYALGASHDIIAPCRSEVSGLNC